MAGRGSSSRSAAAFRSLLRRTSRSLPLQFGLISTVALVVLGVVVGMITSSSIEHRARHSAEERGRVVAVAAIEPALSRDQLGTLTDAGLDRIDRLIQSQGVLATGLRRLKVFDRRERIVYSDDRAQVGRRAAGELVHAALDGKVGSKLTTGLDHDGRGERMIEVYVPLREQLDAPPFGVLEVYLPYAPVEAAILADTRRMQLTLVIGLLLLWLSLFRVVRGASRKLRRHADESVRVALHDSLTGLPNRRLLYERLRSAYAAADDAGPFTLVLLDLDGFKEINDSLGHHTGDLLLCELADRLRGAVGPDDTVARLSGDEFAVVLAGRPDAGRETGPEVERVLATLQAPFRAGDAEVRVRASFGIAPSTSADTADLLVRNADLAMHRAKVGGDRALVFAPEMHEALIERLALEAEMRQALVASQFALHYQPIYDVAEGAVTSLEALLRWPHADGMIEPGRFIPVAEQTGLISELGAWVLDEACRQLRRWQDDGVVDPETTVSVNVSGIQLCDAGFSARVADVVGRHGLAPSNLVLEVTESVLMDERNVAESQLREIRALGVAVALDDFGTGYSSLSRLATLPVDHLKIDRSFVDKIRCATAGDLLTSTILAMGQSLGLTVVAEGVETAEQLCALRRGGCDRVQGYLLSRPVPPAEAAVLMRSRPAAFDHERQVVAVG